MRQRNLFNQVLEFSSDLKGKIIYYRKKHPERIIAAMFLILLIAVAAFLISKATRQDTRRSSINTFLGRVSAPSAATPEKPTANLMDLLSLYGKTRGINPDSLTLKDSLLIKEIDKDLKNILNEKD